MTNGAQTEANRKLGQLLGYRARKAQRRTSYWQLIAPDRSPVSTNLYQSEDAAWDDAPDFSGSVDACESLIPADYDVNFETDKTDGVLTHYAWLEGQWRGTGATRAYALAEAVLAWAQARQPPNGGG